MTEDGCPGAAVDKREPAPCKVPEQSALTFRWIREATSPVPIPRDADFRARVAGEQRKRVSIVMLSWDQLNHSKRFLASLRANTLVEYELIIVDNGSSPETVAWVKDNADVAVLNPENRGFAAGMNQGLARVSSEYVVFINNDTQLPVGWLASLIESLNLRDDVGLVAPVVTNCGGFISLRSCPGTMVLDIHPFGYAPPGVCYAMRTETAREMGGWPEVYRVASGEDTDLCHTLWARGYRILVDERVLVDHVSKGTAAVKLEDWRSLWEQNRARFFERWGDGKGLPVPVQPPPGLREGDLDAIGRTMGSRLESLTRALENLCTEGGKAARKRLSEIKPEVNRLESLVRKSLVALTEDRACHARTTCAIWASIENRRRKRRETEVALADTLVRINTLEKRLGVGTHMAYPPLPVYLWRRFGARLFGGTVVETASRAGYRFACRLIRRNR